MSSSRSFNVYVLIEKDLNIIKNIIGVFDYNTAIDKKNEYDLKMNGLQYEVKGPYVYKKSEFFKVPNPKFTDPILPNFDDDLDPFNWVPK